jgi:ElaA protein
MPLEFDWLPFDRLTGRQVHDVLQLRQRVFVVEQTCPYLDADGADPRCWHGLGVKDGMLVATARIAPPGLKYVEPAIGRVVTAPEVRGTGLGRALMAEGVAGCARVWPGRAIRISAQAHLQRFYGHFGFETVSDTYLEDDIPHVEMLRKAQP